jgi:hypothetical protein
MLRYEEKSPRRFFTNTELLLLINGCLVILGSFMYDYYAKVVAEGGLAVTLNGVNNDNYLGELRQYIPQFFNWWWFWAGLALLVSGVVTYCLRLKKLNMVLF